MSIYILRLQQGKYWVGYTTEPISSIKAFKDLNDWILAYKPESICKIIPAKAYRLDYEVKELMAEVGIDNVRGGSWSDSVLPTTVKQQSQPLMHQLMWALQQFQELAG